MSCDARNQSPLGSDVNDFFEIFSGFRNPWISGGAIDALKIGGIGHET
jgi:hypothetical protein